MTSKPSSSIGDSLGRAPLNRMRPSGPRITEGRSGSDSRACSRRLGSRAISVAVSVLPSSGATGDSGDNVDPTTTVVVVARAISSTMRLTSGRNTVADSKPVEMRDGVRASHGVRNRERAVPFGCDGRRDGRPLHHLDGHAGQWQTGLIDDDAAHHLRGGDGRPSNEEEQRDADDSQ